jgi:hypothetical protein
LGSHNDGVCPKVKSFEYFDNGQIKKVEFHSPGPVVYSPVYFPAVPAPSYPPNYPWYPYISYGLGTSQLQTTATSQLQAANNAALTFTTSSTFVNGKIDGETTITPYYMYKDPTLQGPI